MTTQIPLPQKIVDHIIDFLHDDKHSLSSCALAAHSFLPSCRYHLLHTLSCKTDLEADGREISFWYIWEFFERREHLRAYVKGVNIISDANDGICLCCVSQILELLPNLASFTMCGIAVRDDFCCLRAGPHYPHRGVKSMTFKTTGVFVYDSDIFSLLRLFPEVRDLTCEFTQCQVVSSNPNIMERNANRIMAPNYAPRIGQLVLLGDGVGMMSPFAHLFVTRSMLGDMHDFRALCHDWNDLHPAVQMLQASAKSLLHLAFDVTMLFHNGIVKLNPEGQPFIPLDSSQWQDTGLSSCTALQTFTTSIRFLKIKATERLDADVAVNPTVFQYTLDFLSQLPRNVKEITIFLRFGDQPPMDMLSQDYDWPGLENMIHSLPELRLVRIILLGDPKKGIRSSVEAESIPISVAVEPQQFVAAALTSKYPEKKDVIRVTYEQGYYNECIQSASRE